MPDPGATSSEAATMTEPSDLQARLRAAGEAFLALRPATLAGEPWPLAATFDHSDEASWGPAEVLAHVTEMLPFWLGEIERILEARPPAVSFGRVATDGVRVAIIGRDRTVPLRDLFDRVDSDLVRYERRLGGLVAADLDRVGRHPTQGDMTVADVLERMVISHLEEHATQLARLIGAEVPAG
jgi:hypothetical protein